MIIEMVLCEIGEDGSVKLATIDPIEVKAMGGDLHDHMSNPLFHHLRQDSLKIQGFGSRIGGGDDRLAVTIIDRPDDANRMSCLFKDRFQKVGDRRLSVRPGHADELDLGGGVSIKVRGDPGQGPSAIWDENRCPGESFAPLPEEPFQLPSEGHPQ